MMSRENAREIPPPLTLPHKGEGGVDAAESPSPLWGRVRGRGATPRERFGTSDRAGAAGEA